MLTLPCVRSTSDVGGPTHTLESCEGEPVLSEIKISYHQHTRLKAIYKVVYKTLPLYNTGMPLSSILVTNPNESRCTALTLGLYMVHCSQTAH